MTDILLSKLAHTWLIDVDGTLVKHNGHKNEGDLILPGVKEFWAKIPKRDLIVLLSARSEMDLSNLLDLLSKNELRYDHALFGLPTGERILINDRKPQGLLTALAVNVPRDAGFVHLNLIVDSKL